MNLVVLRLKPTQSKAVTPVYICLYAGINLYCNTDCDETDQLFSYFTIIISCAELTGTKKKKKYFTRLPSSSSLNTI